MFCTQQDVQTAVHIQAETNENRLPSLFNGLSISLLNSFAKTPIAKIVTLPPASQTVTEATSFKDLECTAEDAQKIHHLISTMGEHGKLDLLVNYQKELRQIGRDIDHVHPLKFLSVILSDPYLKSCMKKIHSDYFKWSTLIDGLAGKLTINAKQNKLSIFLNDFAKSINISPDSIQGFVEKQKWEDMTIYLINN